MYIIIIICCLIFLYYKFGFTYAEGVATYTRNNYKGNQEKNDCWKSFLDEKKELFDAIIALSPTDIFLEFFDMVHTIFKFLIVSYLPVRFYHHWFCWMLVFPFVIPSAIKLAYRVRENGCIRNHDRDNLHICRYNKNLF